MDKIEEINVKNVYKNNKEDLKIMYDIKLSHCGASWWVENMEAIYEKKYKMITHLTRPTRIKQSKLISMILDYMVNNELIKE